MSFPSNVARFETIQLPAPVAPLPQRTQRLRQFVWHVQQRATAEQQNPHAPQHFRGDATTWRREASGCERPRVGRTMLAKPDAPQ